MSWGGKLTLHGVTLRNGKTENYGGCGWVISHATLIANHVVMRDCWATEEAGGLYADFNSELRVTNSRFEDCKVRAINTDNTTEDPSPFSPHSGDGVNACQHT